MQRNQIIIGSLAALAICATSAQTAQATCYSPELPGAAQYTTKAKEHVTIGSSTRTQEVTGCAEVDFKHEEDSTMRMSPLSSRWMLSGSTKEIVNLGEGRPITGYLEWRNNENAFAIVRCPRKEAGCLKEGEIYPKGQWLNVPTQLRTVNYAYGCQASFTSEFSPSWSEELENATPQPWPPNELTNTNPNLPERGATWEGIFNEPNGSLTALQGPSGMCGMVGWMLGVPSPTRIWLTGWIWSRA